MFKRHQLKPQTFLPNLQDVTTTALKCLLHLICIFSVSAHTDKFDRFCLAPNGDDVEVSLPKSGGDEHGNEHGHEHDSGSKDSSNKHCHFHAGIEYVKTKTPVIDLGQNTH